MLHALRLLFLLSLILFLNNCDNSKHSAATKNTNIIKIGTIAGPETDLIRVAQKVAKEKYNLDIQIVEFLDYAIPNAALHDGSIDMNIYQHEPYLRAAQKARNYNFTILGKTFVYPMGIYSKKIKNINDLQNLKHKAIIAIPNDPSNETRALLLLEKAGLIELDQAYKVKTNPKKFKLKPLEAAQLPRILEDVDLAIINTNYALPAGLKPKTDALLIESGDSQYANLIVIRQADEHNQAFELLLLALQSEEIQEKAKELFQNQAIPAWQAR